MSQSSEDHAQVLDRQVSQIVHDFNNTLVSMRGFAEFLCEDLSVGSPQRIYAEKLLAGVEQMIGQVDELRLNRGQKK